MLMPMMVAAQQQNTTTIDRHAVVNRNNPIINEFNPNASLTVGNGHFATTVDVTGLQSYPEVYMVGIPLTAMSDWGWHSFKNTKQLLTSESEKAFDYGHGHEEIYAVEYKKPEDGRHKEATEYFRVNPHRLNLGTIGLNLKDSKGEKIWVDKLTDIHQELKLFDGEIASSFKADGEAVEVTTGVHPNKDALYTRIKSNLLKKQRATIDIRFAYPTGKHADEARDNSKPDMHQSKIISQTAHSALIERTLDATTYYVLLQWEGKANIAQIDCHYFALSTTGNELSFSATYSEKKPETT